MRGDPLESLAEQPGWAIRLLRRFRPVTGWSVFVFSLGAVLLLPVALADGNLLNGLNRTVLLSLASFVFAWWLALGRLSGIAATVLIALTGVITDLLWGVFVLRPGALAAQLLSWWSWASSSRLGPEPAITFFHEQWTLLAGYFQRVGWWIRGLVVGPGSPDNLAVIGLIALLVWLIAAWGAWWIARHGQAFVALLPTGAFLAQYAYWAPKTLGYVLLLVGVTAFLLVLVRMVFNMRAWDQAGVDFAEEIRFDTLLSALGLTLIVTFLSPSLPFLASGEFSQRFWKVFESPWRRVEEQVSASFRVAQPVRSLVPPTGAAPGGLPRAHLLGGQPELGEEIALRVSVRGDPSDWQLYWRGQTYAVYTGRGWEAGAEGLAEQSFEAGEPWGIDLPSNIGRRPVVVSVETLAASRSVIYAPLEPIAVDRPYRALLRSPGDLVALSLERPASAYTVLAYVPSPDAATLSAAGAAYPSSVVTHYLQLPSDLDPRLSPLVASWIGGSVTQYDKALAIERQLRNFAYSLELPLPPENRELVSWFVFDLRRGYCDYYASAMVVMARLAGIPARLAIGYATGDLDEGTGQYVVTELQAHSWPELYFPGVGWLPFEPTAGRPLPVREGGEAVSGVPPGIRGGPEDLDSGMAELQERVRENVAAERRQAAGRGLWTAAVALILVWAIWLNASSRQPLPAAGGGPLVAYDRLLVWGRRLGRPIRRGETPREYLSALGRVVDKVADRARWRKQSARRAASVVTAEGALLTAEVERSLFAPDGTAAQPLSQDHRVLVALRELWIVQAASRLQDPSRPTR